MWTQYTREKPAKPGWTIATMAVALAATIGLAQMQVSANKPVEWKATLAIKADTWPIAFQLPNVLDWSKQPTNESTPPNEITYIGKEGDDLVCRVSFFCGDMNDKGLEQHLVDILDEPPVDSFSIKIAKEKGVAMMFPAGSGNGHIVWCRADRVDRTIMSVVIESRKSKSFTLKLADWICEAARAVE
ncbi:MAG: hypothetical protein H6818_22800 [Phycisphaerales bacterium]|nr:hypothetical protein [Phycisphaerales bacterium]